MTTTSDGDERLLTVDELAAAAGTTVRTTRYYATLGLLPPPVLRGRVGYYGDVHRARLELVRALQEHGFTLQAIEGLVADLPADAGVEELALRRAMLTSWTPGGRETLTRAELEREAGRTLSDHDLEVLAVTGAVVRDGADGDRFQVQPALHLGLELLDVDVSLDSLGRAEQAVSRHMESLADELTAILHEQVLEPYRTSAHAPEDAARMEQTVLTLRRLVLEAVVSGFQRAANDVITRSLGREQRPGTPG